MGVVEGASASEVSQLINASGVDLVLSDLLSSNNGGRMGFVFVPTTCHLSIWNANVSLICRP